MKRTELRRRTPLKRVNPRRRRQRFAKAYESAEKVEWLRGLPCRTCNELPSQAAHARSRGAGGTSKDLLPLCWLCHSIQHSLGVKTFQEMHDIDLTAEAARYEQLWQALGAARDGGAHQHTPSQSERRSHGQEKAGHGGHDSETQHRND